jgi:hypothetical protein
LKIIGKEIWSGFLRAIGGAAAAAVGTAILLLWPAFREWVVRLAGGDVLSRTAIAITILIALNIVFFALWIASEIRFFRLRRRVRDKKLTLGDLMNHKQLMEATDVEGTIRKRVDGLPSAVPSQQRPRAIHLTHGQMIQSINSVSPFQQSDVMKSFLGKRVSWSARLHSISSPLGNVLDAPYPVYVFCNLVEDRNDQQASLFCWASETEASALVNTRRGDLIRVSGTIKDVAALGSTLEDCTFESDHKS